MSRACGCTHTHTHTRPHFLHIACSGSVLTYHAQSCIPTQALLRAEAGAQASILATPMYALPPTRKPRLTSVGAPRDLPRLDTMCCAARIRVAVIHGRLAHHLQRIGCARESDEALLHCIPPGGLGVLASRCYKKLWRRPTGCHMQSATVRPSSELPIHTCFVSQLFGQDLVFYTSVYAISGQRALTMMRRSSWRGVFRALPPYVGMASLRVVANAWMTTRRLAHALEHCRFGCPALGGGCLQHYSNCHHARCAVRASASQPPHMDPHRIRFGHVSPAILARTGNLYRCRLEVEPASGSGQGLAACSVEAVHGATCCPSMAARSGSLLFLSLLGKPLMGRVGHQGLVCGENRKFGNTYIYIQIHTNAYIFMHLHTCTDMYRQIHTSKYVLPRCASRVLVASTIRSPLPLFCGAPPGDRLGRGNCMW